MPSSMRALAAQVRTAFNRTFFNADANQYDRNSQTANAMPLVLGIVPEDRRAAVMDNLVKTVRAGGNRVTAGDVGFTYLVRALSDGGHGNVLYDIVCQRRRPGLRLPTQEGRNRADRGLGRQPGLVAEPLHVGPCRGVVLSRAGRHRARRVRAPASAGSPSGRRWWAT